MKIILKPSSILNTIIKSKSNSNFPNNPKFPFLIYKEALNLDTSSAKDVEKLLEKNNWSNAWVNGVYDYHHYHSNTHEVLVIISGDCDIQVGGDEGDIFRVKQGDVVIFPVGVSHKRIKSSKDFKCVGAYPEGKDYDMKYGVKKELTESEKNIQKVPLPKADPIYGKSGILFDYWAKV